jgi:hypothetical protein
MVFNSLQPTPLANRLTMRGIVSVLLSVAHSDYRSLGKRYTTINTMSLRSAVCTWSVPGPDHAKIAPLQKLGNGWSTSGVVTLQSGLPFSILDSAAGTLFGPATLYTTGNLAPSATLADASRSGSASSRVNEFFNTSAFVPAPFVPDGGLIDGKYPVSGGGTIFGNLGRNILRGPDQQDFDIAAIKTTPLTGHVKLIFRWEVFNVLNRPNFANPSNDVSTPSTFGVVSALSVNPRIMQYALKVEF